MRRREFIALLGGAAVVADCGPRIAFLGSGGRKKEKPFGDVPGR
jgi:hypothetical protein